MNQIKNRTSSATLTTSTKKRGRKTSLPTSLQQEMETRNKKGKKAKSTAHLVKGVVVADRLDRLVATSDREDLSDFGLVQPSGGGDVAGLGDRNAIIRGDALVL
jgi:hypothetical protein